jgi:hypothetical protein
LWSDEERREGSPVVFWFWVVLTVLVVPAISFGTLLAAMYLYLRSRHPEKLGQVFKAKP